MDQLAMNAGNVLVNAGMQGVMMLGMAAYIYWQSRQIIELQRQNIAVQRQLSAALRGNTAAYVRFCEMLNDRPCFHQASALQAAQTHFGKSEEEGELG